MSAEKQVSLSIEKKIDTMEIATEKENVSFEHQKLEELDQPV